MHQRSLILTVSAALMVTGCASGPSFLDAAQADAVQEAQRRAQAELGCESGTGQVTARETLNTPPPQRVAYEVLVTGCGQRRTFVVQCTKGAGCYAGAGRAAQ